MAAAMIAPSRDGGAPRKPRPLTGPRPRAEKPVGLGMLEPRAVTAGLSGGCLWVLKLPGTRGVVPNESVFSVFLHAGSRKGAGSTSEPAGTPC